MRNKLFVVYQLPWFEHLHLWLRNLKLVEIYLKSKQYWNESSIFKI